MGSDELIANLLRISQTKQKLKKDNVQTEKEANDAHYELGSKIKKTKKSKEKVIWISYFLIY